MKRFKEFLNSYIVEFDWKDIAIFKLCLTAFGMMIGISLPKRKRNSIMAICGSVFVLTTIVLFARLFGVACPFCQEEEDFEDEDEDEDEKGFVMRITAEDE